MANVNYLITLGLTNYNTEDIGIIATGKPHKVFALCCSNVYSETHEGPCKRCGHYLFWRREPFHLADDMIEKYLKRSRPVRSTVATVAV